MYRHILEIYNLNRNEKKKKIKRAYYHKKVISNQLNKLLKNKKKTLLRLLRSELILITRTYVKFFLNLINDSGISKKKKESY